MIVNELRLLLNSLSQAQIALKHLLHHIQSMNYSLSYGIFRLVGSRVRLHGVLLALVGGYVFKLVGFLSEELVNLLLVFDDALSDDLSVFDYLLLLWS